MLQSGDDIVERGSWKATGTSLVLKKHCAANADKCIQLVQIGLALEHSLSQLDSPSW
jgi:hypothetical protein